MNIEDIRRYCEEGALRWTNHVVSRLLQRHISMDDVAHALKNGEIIEQYPTDYPYPSCLVLGMSLQREHLHVVCGDSGTELWLITVYYPNENEWTDAFRKRKEPRK